MQKRGKPWKEFLAVNQIRDEEEKEEVQEDSGFMKDIDEEIPVSKASRAPLPVGSIRTKNMQKEDAKRAEKDKIFTTYSRRTRRTPKTQLQEDQFESHAPAQMDVESGDHSLPAPEVDMEVESRNKQEKCSPPPTKRQKKLEKQIEELKEELMEANMLEKVIKRENEMLRAQSKETQKTNEKLKERISELETEQTEISNWATKWYNQKKALKEKYKKLKKELKGQKDHQVKKNVDTLLKAAEIHAGTEFKESTSG